MNREELIEFHKTVCTDARELMKIKNNDYTGDRGIFFNFEVCERLGICSTEEGFMVRFTDKVSRIITFIKNGKLQVKDESVRDTLIDIINYAILLSALIESKRGDRSINAHTENTKRKRHKI